MSFGFASSYLALWIWAIFQGLLTLAVFRQVLALEKRAVHGVAPGELLVGTRAPQFAGVDYHSRQPIGTSIFNEQGGAILFLAASCAVCRKLAKGLQDAPPGSLPPIVALCIGGEQQSAKIAKRLGQKVPLLLQGAEEVVSQYRVTSYPTAVVLDGERMIKAYTTVSSVEDIQQLVARSHGRYTVHEELTMADAGSRQEA